MLEPILGTLDTERILVFIMARNEAFGSEIAEFFDSPYTGIRRQLKRLEQGGVIYSIGRGNTVVYEFNPRYPFLIELKSL